MENRQKPISEKIEILEELTEFNPKELPRLSGENPEYEEALSYFRQFYPLEQETIFGRKVADFMRQNDLYIRESG